MWSEQVCNLVLRESTQIDRGPAEGKGLAAWLLPQRLKNRVGLRANGLDLEPRLEEELLDFVPREIAEVAAIGQSRVPGLGEDVAGLGTEVCVSFEVLDVLEVGHARKNEAPWR